MFRIEHNAQTGEIKEIALTAKEIAEVEANQELDQKRTQSELERIAARKSILEKLGLTEEEAKLLLG